MNNTFTMSMKILKKRPDSSRKQTTHTGGILERQMTNRKITKME
jgi:hypothetical protein